MYIHRHTIRTSRKGGYKLEREKGRVDGRVWKKDREGVRAHGRGSVPP